MTIAPAAVACGAYARAVSASAAKKARSTPAKLASYRDILRVNSTLALRSSRRQRVGQSYGHLQQGKGDAHMHAPVKFIEKGLSLAANGAWAVRLAK